MSSPPDFATLVDAHYRGLYWFALGLSGHAADADDLTQQTFYRWATHGHRLREAGAAKAWLFRTLYREFLRLRHRAGREAPLPPEDELDAVLDDQAMARCDGEAVLAAVQNLPTEQAAVVSMFYLRAFSYQEIADVLGVPIGTVMSRLARAKAALRRLLAAPRADVAAVEPEPARIIPFPTRGHG